LYLYGQDRQCIYKRNSDARSHKLCSRGKAIRITYSESVSLVLVTQNGRACALLHCRVLLVQIYHKFPRYLTKSTIFLNFLLNIKCVFLFSLQYLPKYSSF